MFLLAFFLIWVLNWELRLTKTHNNKCWNFSNIDNVLRVLSFLRFRPVPLWAGVSLHPAVHSLHHPLPSCPQCLRFSPSLSHFKSRVIKLFMDLNLHTVPSGKTQRSWFAVWLAVSPFRITIGWKIWGVPKNLGNSHDDGHWNFLIFFRLCWDQTSFTLEQPIFVISSCFWVEDRANQTEKNERWVLPLGTVVGVQKWLNACKYSSEKTKHK